MPEEEDTVLALRCGEEEDTVLLGKETGTAFPLAPGELALSPDGSRGLHLNRNGRVNVVWELYINGQSIQDLVAAILAAMTGGGGCASA